MMRNTTDQSKQAGDTETRANEATTTSLPGYLFQKAALWTPKSMALLLLWSLSICFSIAKRILPRIRSMNRADQAVQSARDDLKSGRSMVGIRWQQIQTLLGHRVSSITKKYPMFGILEKMWFGSRSQESDMARRGEKKQHRQKDTAIPRGSKNETETGRRSNGVGRAKNRDKDMNERQSKGQNKAPAEASSAMMMQMTEDSQSPADVTESDNASRLETSSEEEQSKDTDTSSRSKQKQPRKKKNKRRGKR
jgi:hypothetical protein